MKPKVSIFLDQRRSKTNNTYPIKLRVYSPFSKTTKFYPIDKDMTETLFESVWQTERPRVQHQPLRQELQKLEIKGQEIADKLNPFTFEEFEKRMFNNYGTSGDVFHYYKMIIHKCHLEDRSGTAENYEQSMKSIESFTIARIGKLPKSLPFRDITPTWLMEYEKYMLKNDRSISTVGIYLRPLRAVFNLAKGEKTIDEEVYPFGKKKYQIPAARNIKKALNPDQLRILFEAKIESDEQTKARDFWFFSYASNGINIKDILQLRFENIYGNTIVLYRAKTANSTKTDRIPITIYLNDFHREIINKYGNIKKDKKQFIFPILNVKDTPIECHRKSKNFTKFINQSLKVLAKHLGLPTSISVMWARHSFASVAVNKGASMEMVGEALSHSNVKTTQNYFAGFEEAKKKEMSKNIMKF
jgi:integrase/recombinase XerD